MFFLLFLLILSVVGCSALNQAPDKENRTIEVLYVPALEPMVTGCIDLLKTTNPDIRVIPVPANNTSDIITKITTHAILADIIFVADYPGIERMMAPEYIDWDIRYGNCGMVLSYTNASPFADIISTDNWYGILETENITTGIVNPGSADARGWRSLITLDLADTYYNQTVFTRVLSAETGIRREITLNGTIIDAVNPVSTSKIRFFDNFTEMTQAVKNGTLDYALNYWGGASKSGFEIVDLPDEIDLSNSRFADWYSDISVQTRKGSKKSSPIVFAVTIPLISDNKEDASAFLRMMFSPEGEKMLTECGLIPIIPPEYIHFTSSSRIHEILPGIEFRDVTGSVPALP